ncbi:MAG: glycosyltransferase, partial [gamma proteobacterium symbiont of Ctena orbiculata]
MESPARESVPSSEAYYYRQAADDCLKPVDHRLAVILPCYNEEAAIARVISDFRLALPAATVYVFDNNSTDRTAEMAELAGAVVMRVNLPGKGNVVRRMFADVDADIYVMADGDATYHAPSAPMMIGKLLRDNLDMVVGIRSHH